MKLLAGQVYLFLVCAISTTTISKDEDNFSVLEIKPSNEENITYAVITMKEERVGNFPYAVFQPGSNDNINVKSYVPNFNETNLRNIDKLVWNVDESLFYLVNEENEKVFRVKLENVIFDDRTQIESLESNQIFYLISTNGIIIIMYEPKPSVPVKILGTLNSNIAGYFENKEFILRLGYKIIRNQTKILSIYCKKFYLETEDKELLPLSPSLFSQNICLHKKILLSVEEDMTTMNKSGEENSTEENATTTTTINRSAEENITSTMNSNETMENNIVTSSDNEASSNNTCCEETTESSVPFWIVIVLCFAILIILVIAIIRLCLTRIKK